jgi:putative transposase
MMRDDNLLAIQPKRFVVTTNSKPKCEVHLNLASRMTLTGINQLWVADLTYVRLKGEFVYLAVILDGFSRKVVGWAVDRTLMSSYLTVAALERAVADRRPQARLVHHSDRGLQYASPEYVAALDRHSMVASMSRPASHLLEPDLGGVSRLSFRHRVYQAVQQFSSPFENSLTCSAPSW